MAIQITYRYQSRLNVYPIIEPSLAVSDSVKESLTDLAAYLRHVYFPPLLHALCSRRGLFKGRLVIHSGGIASGFRNSTEGDSYDTDGVSLFHVKGTQPDNTYGVQVMTAMFMSTKALSLIHI